MGYKDIVLRLRRTAKFGCEALGPENQTALHAAIRGRYTDCVRALLAKAPRLVTYGDHKGWTALHYAAYYKYDSILDDILDLQDQVSDLTEWEDFEAKMKQAEGAF
ncbi:hypothetical protein POM88_013106 [Heracleum sosnowskyi]|uniref:Uncharacterized protein n=1 Tax=Heracleum sosnowskyi TaxID=360622 RepID=A0AAD8MXT7_9APIA|nr:hypothetical protein POM88_013106 [Heracleum sosnowskyi]